MSTHPADLTIENLSKGYPGAGGTVPALEELSVCVDSGSTLAVLGPSGCGKSTLLRLIAGIEAPDAGRIVLGGRELSRLDLTVDADRRGINMVFQNYALWPHLRVRDIIGYGLLHGRHRTDRARREAKVAELVELLQLAGLEDRRPAEISGGQQQRVAIARALATEPDLLLFDEPLSNLDVQLRATMRTDLATLLRRLSTTAVYVTHDVTEALALADRILVLDHGRAVQLDTARAVFSRPATPWVAAMAGFSSRLVPQRVDRAAGEARVILGDETLLGQACGDGSGGPDGTNRSPQVFIHPDAVRLVYGLPAGAAGTVSGVVTACVYEGRAYRVTVQIPDAGTVSLLAPSSLEPETRVALSIDPDGVLVFGRAA
ncbi:ABC transporter ATP-binding protein [Ruania suaedae]|uniref:ABC transporter ATP-binding protein n=1 Tax=Ruania suaedae TaxID=2897774 RepID=UPI001E451BF7|nr:ABC transporter ATP-binding protein [Ruania suaedae]UFU03855.1 ABC transporter ATP-binding protein [Ruania suaedae]